jgi:hypothetical protein
VSEILRGPGCICTIVLPIAIPNFEMLPHHSSQLQSLHGEAGQGAYRVGMANGDIVDVRYECASVDGCSEKRILRAKDVKKRDLQRIDELEVPACQPQLVTKPSPSLPGNNSGSVNGSLTVTALAGNPSAPQDRYNWP